MAVPRVYVRRGMTVWSVDISHLTDSLTSYTGRTNIDFLYLYTIGPKGAITTKNFACGASSISPPPSSSPTDPFDPFDPLKKTHCTEWVLVKREAVNDQEHARDEEERAGGAPEQARLAAPQEEKDRDHAPQSVGPAGAAEAPQAQDGQARGQTESEEHQCISWNFQVME